MRVRAERRRLAGAVAAAVVLHAGLGAALMTRAPDTLPALRPEIPVSLVMDAPEPALPAIEEPLPVEPLPPKLNAPEDVPQIADAAPPQPEAAVHSKPVTAPPHPAPTESAPAPINPCWALSAPPQAETIAPVVEGLSSDLACINSTDPACEAVRIDLYAEHMLSESDKVWMPSFAHSGLSDPRFRGMDEAQIRAELGIPTAGANGFYLPFSPVGISSYWLDPLYGVKKRCKMVVGKRRATEEYAGQTVVGQDCGEMRGALGDQPLWRKEWEPGGYDRPRPEEWMLKE